ncbi:hypothetical protein [Nocardioides sp. AX2bis]|uniref:hypothetical protein n=1 Tax=Nocardioides sp. AX2bis TaxID=2653157 RepID=UPI0012EF3B9F|nr:hypothetical protein [Nocardioides sp. AX2bis]VXB06164.1 HEAT repeat-containing protein [Nocardioides sp. AX2bis]
MTAPVHRLPPPVGVDEAVRCCRALLRGAPREEHLALLPWLTGHAWAEGDPVRDPVRWGDHWVRHWGARGLLHVWSDTASVDVVAGLADEHWRPAETCLRVVARHDVAGAGPGAYALAQHPLPRVRAQAARALAVAGDVEHAGALEALRDDPDPAVSRAAGRAWPVLAARLDLADEPGRRRLVSRQR